LAIRRVALCDNVVALWDCCDGALRDFVHVARGTVVASWGGMLSYEKLDVYKAAIEFLAVCDEDPRSSSKGELRLADQLRRAGISIPLNIAESSGKPTMKDRQRFIAIARGSAMESGAILDVCRVLELSDSTTLDTGKQLLVRIVSMLTKMCR